MSSIPKPMILLILDGWGHSEQTMHNAIAQAEKPFWDSLWQKYPHSFIDASGASVGLPSEQMGNSEVGHLNLGAGRVVYQEYTRVSRSIRTGSFFSNQTLVDAVEQAVQTDKAIHIMGLLSPGGVHSHEDHIHAMAELAVKKGADKVYLHCFLDGRDTAPKSATESIVKLQAKLDELGSGQIASIIGRYYAMDRDNRWPRVMQAYDLMTLGEAEYTVSDALTGINDAYERAETDEFIQATAIVPPGKQPVKMNDGDVLVFMNYRSDRARQITRPFIEPDFDGFERKSIPKLGSFASLTEYKSDFDIPVAYPPERLNNVFGAYISSLGMSQLRIAETEKYAHVTFFFNGGREEPFEFEDRELIKSPNVATYDLQPEMSAFEVTDKLVAAINSEKYDTIICNFANPDMVGHTGNFKATVKAIEAIDKCLKKVVAAAKKAGGELLITADHGNAEMMENEETHQPHTAHTTNLVPLIYVGNKHDRLIKLGALSDIAPTMLDLMDIEQPSEMSGRSLIERDGEDEAAA